MTENFDNVNNVAIEAKSLSTETNTPMHAGAFSILVIFIIPTCNSDPWICDLDEEDGKRKRQEEKDGEKNKDK